MSPTPADPLERFLTLSRADTSELTNDKVMYFLHALEAPQKETTCSQENEELVQVEDVIEKPSALELKQLLENLRYAFLGE